ncbi:hypothetical protein D3C81_2096060 [compost metagenome]
MKASSAPAGNVCRKVAATKASEVEHRESTKASPIMNRYEPSGFSPIAVRLP